MKSHKRPVLCRREGEEEFGRCNQKGCKIPAGLHPATWQDRAGKAEKRHLYRSFRGSNSGAGKYLRPDRNGIVRQGRNPGDFNPFGNVVKNLHFGVKPCFQTFKAV